MSELRRTPLYDRHRELGGKLVPFAGWELPVQYSGVIAEHAAVRSAAGLFDVSHMGEIFVEGPEATAALNYLTCNDIGKLTDGKAQYGAILNPSGGVVDDIIVYRYTATRYLICVNASNAEKDFAWFQKNNRHRAEFTDRSREFGQVALQGPRAVDVLKALGTAGESLALLSYFSFTETILDGVPVIVARTGYTGEDGFEIFVPWAKTLAIWDLLLARGKGIGLVPAGLGARDSLRLEACYPLHGHELGEEISAIESGLGWIVKPAKGEFIGREVVADQIRRGAPRTLVGFVLDEPGIAREGTKIFDASGAEAGVVTSGTKTPTLNVALGMALVHTAHSALDTVLDFEVRGKRLRGHVVKRPFYKRTTR